MSSLRNAREADPVAAQSEGHVRDQDRLSRDGPLHSTDFVLADGERAESAKRSFRFGFVANAQEEGYPIEFVTESLLQLVGKKRDDLVGSRWSAILDSEENAAVIEDFSQELRSRRGLSRSIRMSGGRGAIEKGAWRLSLAPILDQNQTLLKYFGAFEITDDASSQEDGSDSSLAREGRSGGFVAEGVWLKVHSLLTAAAITDARRQTAPIIASTAGFQSVTGFSNSDIRQTPLSDLFCRPPEDSGDKSFALAKDVASMTAATAPLYKKDGTPFQALTCSFPLCQNSADLSAARCLHVIVDVTAAQSERLGNYILGRTLGHGASGIVRVAKTTDADEILAVKIVDATKFRSITEIELVQDEITALSSLRHDNIVNLREVLFEEQVFYFVMDFAAGGSLAQYLRARDQLALSEFEAHDIFTQIVAAVSYCHRRRVIHRDLKPENILLDGEGCIRVADFGLSAIAAPCGSLSNVCGTPEFLAPEVLSSNEFDGAMADIYSMGIVLHELLTGKTPFRGESRASLFRAIQNGVMEPLPSTLSSACRDLISRMLVKNPEQRITMEEILIHPWLKNRTSFDHSTHADATDGLLTTSPVHESAKLTLGDWASDDAISHAIVNGDYSRSPSIVIVRGNSNSQTVQKLSQDLEALRADAAHTNEKKKGYRKFFKKPGHCKKLT